MTVSQIRELLSPKSIAIVGASNNIRKMGAHHLLSIIHDGFKGEIYPIHPKKEQILGLKAYKTVADLPCAPDLAIFVVPAVHVPELLEAFGKKGTRYAIIITAGFKETGADGVLLENRIKRIAETYGMRFVGPNCIGVINSEVSLNTTVNPMPKKPGVLGLVSQSGTYVTQVVTYLEQRGIAFSKAVSVGNEANITLTDVLEYLGEDDATRAIALYIEGIKNVPHFLETARRISRRKPIVAQYTGGSKAGARSSLGHTGAMAAPDYLYEGLFKQAGIIRVHTVRDLFWTGWTLATQPPLKGRRIGIVTNSGGPGSAIANECERNGLEVSPFSETLKMKLRPYLEAHAPCGNPVDLTFSMDLLSFSKSIPELIIKENEADGIIFHGFMQTGPARAKYSHLKELLKGLSLDDMIAFMEAEPKTSLSLPDIHGPMLLSSFYGGEDNCVRTCLENNIPVFSTPEQTAHAMAALYRYGRIREREEGLPIDLPEPLPEARKIIDGCLKNGQKALSEFDAKKLLGLYGLPVSREILAASEEEAVKGAEEMGYPVVLKGCTPDILHKTEKGLVWLNLDSIDKVRAAYRTLSAASGPGGSIPVIVSEMIRGSREFMAGMVREKNFGPAILFGLGGIFTEVLKDMTFRLSPLTVADARDMLADIKGAALLGECRGMPAVNRDQMASILFRLSLVSIIHPEIGEIDLNPIMIRGESPVIVDALIAIKEVKEEGA